MADEEGDAAAFFEGKEPELQRPEDAEWPPWATHVYDAWLELRDDRHYGAMGGLGRVHFVAIDRYAERFGITGDSFADFLLFFRVIDDEYVAITLERQKEEAEERKRKGG